jgi:putative transposase
VRTHSVDGLIKVSSHPSGHLEAIDYIISKNISKKIKTRLLQTNRTLQNRIFVTAGCLPRVRKMTSSARLNTCGRSSQTTRLSPTSDQASTSVGRACGPSWSSLVKVQSPKLWLPTETGCAALHSNWLNGSFSSMESNSWFSIKKWMPQETQNLPKTCWQSSMCSIAESMEGENIKTAKERKSKLKKSKKVSANYSKKIGLRPTPEVAAILKQWFGSVRHTYNWTLGCIKAKPKEYPINMIWLRKRFVNKVNIPKDKQFLLDTPKHLRDSALHDLVEAYKSNFTKKAKDPSFTFDMKYRSKKDSQCITIPTDAIKQWDSKNGEFSMYPTYIKNRIKFHLRKTSSVPDKVLYESKLIMDKRGKFYMVLTYNVCPCENQAGHDWCSIDPGVRTMLTVYSPTTGVCYKIGDKDIGRIFRLCKGLDKLISSTEAEKKKQSRRRKKKAQLRLRERIRNLVTEVHCKAVKFLLSNFKNIVLPSFDVSQMVKRSNRKIRSKTVRQMLCWRHYAFKQRLINRAKLYTDANVYIRTEEWTSKTCTHCQHVKNNLGGSKTYRCDHCGLVADRDACGARNIFLKNTALGGNT